MKINSHEFAVMTAFNAVVTGTISTSRSFTNAVRIRFEIDGREFSFTLRRDVAEAFLANLDVGITVWQAAGMEGTP